VLSVSQKIAVVGAGAIGGYYGALLARTGSEVNFLLRCDLASVRAHGLRVKQPPAGDFTLQPVRAFGAAAAETNVRTADTRSRTRAQFMDPLFRQEMRRQPCRNG
jgi:ketopantoate reductase